MSFLGLRTSDDELVDARFLRPLSPREMKRLEAHLQVDHAAAERYRRLQLAERVAAHGPERALDEPSCGEMERIARDLGLVTKPRFRFAWGSGIKLMSLAVATVIAVIFLALPPDDVLTARGDRDVPLSFSAYVLSQDGAIRSHRTEDPLRVSDHLKLRVSWLGEDAAPTIGSVQVALVGERIEIHSLGAIDLTGKKIASIPGAVPLATAPPQTTQIYIIARSERIDPDELSEQIAADRLADALRVEKLEVRMVGDE